MKFLVDNALPPGLAEALRVAGHDAIHVLEVGLAEASDSAIMSVAGNEERVVSLADADFSRILALQGLAKPSLLFLRGELPRRAMPLAKLVLSRLQTFEAALTAGAVVTMTPTRTRIRDQSGAPAGSGKYFVRIETESGFTGSSDGVLVR